MSKWSELWERVKSLFEGALADEPGGPDGDMDEVEEACGDGKKKKDRAIKEVDSWDGSASRFESTDAYCAACLIDVNSAAGRDTKAQSHCMLPVRGPGDGASTYVRQAVHGAAQRFGQVQRPDDVPQAVWDTAVTAAANKLISAYGEMDETAPDSIYEAAGKEPQRQRALGMQQIFEQVYSGLDAADRESGAWSWPVDIFEDAGSLYVIVAREGRLYRVPLAIEGTTVTLGDWQEVITQHVAAPAPALRTVVHRQADGRYRWLSVSATSALNRVGEIDSRELFDRFIEHAQADGYPERDLYHLEDAAPVGRCDTILRDGNCLITSGLYYETPLAQAVRRATEAGLMAGDSISYRPMGGPDLVEVAPGVRLPVYRDGVLRFIASLPEGEAASLFTATAVREVYRMNDRVRQALLALKEYGLTDEDVDGIEARVDATNRTIDDREIVTREATTEPGAAGEEPEPTPDPEPAAAESLAVERELVLGDEELAALAATVFESDTVRALQATLEETARAVETLTARVAELAGQAETQGQDVARRLAALEQTDDDKRREWLADLPARQPVTVTYRPREAHGDGEIPPSMDAIAAAVLNKIPAPRAG